MPFAGIMRQGMGKTEVFDVKIIWSQSDCLACMRELKFEALNLTYCVAGKFRRVNIAASFANIL